MDHLPTIMPGEDRGTQALIARLCEAIESARPAVPLKLALWGIAEIAACLHCSRDVAQTMTALPDFPEAYRFPSTGSGRRGHPRWKAVEVATWCERYREGRKA